MAEGPEAVKPTGGLPPKLNARNILPTTPKKEEPVAPAPPPVAPGAPAPAPAPFSTPAKDLLSPRPAGSVKPATSPVGQPYRPAASAKPATAPASASTVVSAKPPTAAPTFAPARPAAQTPVTAGPALGGAARPASSPAPAGASVVAKPAMAAGAPAPVKPATIGTPAVGAAPAAPAITLTAAPVDVVASASDKGTTTPMEAVAEAVAPAVGAKPKSDTSRVRLEQAQAAKAAPSAKAPPSGGVLGQGAGTIRLTKKPGEGAAPAVVAKKPLGVPAAIKPAAAPVSAPAAAPKAVAPAAKSDTSRVRLEAAVPAGMTTSPGDVQTMRMKKSSLGAETAEGDEQGGPKTIRLKKPDGNLGAIGKKGETVRITLDDDMAATAPTASSTAKTIQVKKGAVAAAPSASGESADEAAGGKTVKTIKVKRSGAPAAESAEEDDGTLKFRRGGGRGGDVTERSQRLAEQEEALQFATGKKHRAEDDQESIWICLVALAAMVVVGVLLWVFSAQLFPTQKAMNWPGKILSWNSSFYKSEGKWL